MERLQCRYDVDFRHIVRAGYLQRVGVTTCHEDLRPQLVEQHLHSDDQVHARPSHDAHSVGVEHLRVLWVSFQKLFVRVDPRLSVNPDVAAFWHLVVWLEDVLRLRSVDRVEHALHGALVPACEELLRELALAQTLCDALRYGRGYRPRVGLALQVVCRDVFRVALALE